MTVRELRRLASERRLPGRSKMNKAELEAALGIKPVPTVAELKAQAKRLGLKGYSRLRKSELLKAIETANRQRADLAAIIEKFSQKVSFPREKSVEAILPQPIRTPDADLIAALAALPPDESAAQAMARTLWGTDGPKDRALLLQREREAARRLRDQANEFDWQLWNQRYQRLAGKIL